MAVTKVNKPAALCDWCGRETDHDLVAITLVTPRGAFRDEICEACHRAFETPPE